MQIPCRLGQSGPDPSPSDQVRSEGGMSRRQSIHAESGVHYRGQGLSEKRPFQNLEEKASELAELEHCRARPR